MIQLSYFTSPLELSAFGSATKEICKSLQLLRTTLMSLLCVSSLWLFCNNLSVEYFIGVIVSLFGWLSFFFLQLSIDFPISMVYDSYFLFPALAFLIVSLHSALVWILAGAGRSFSQNLILYAFQWGMLWNWAQCNAQHGDCCLTNIFLHHSGKWLICAYWVTQCWNI